MTAENFRPKPPHATGAYCAPGAAVCGATPAAASGPAHVEEPVAYDALLLLGFGGPEGQDDVIPFLRNVTAGRGIPDARISSEAFGEANPRVPTADGVRELQNRRVEITYGPGSGM